MTPTVSGMRKAFRERHHLGEYSNDVHLYMSWYIFTIESCRIGLGCCLVLRIVLWGGAGGWKNSMGCYLVPRIVEGGGLAGQRVDR